MKPILLSSIIAAVSLAGTSNAYSVDNNSFIGDTEFSAKFRYRAESVDASNDKKSSLANTLRTRLAIQTGKAFGLSAFIEGDNITHITDDFNDKENGNTEYNVVLDQETTQFNQAYLRYETAGMDIKLGNQRILLDNQRHVGSVGFRQDEATFDGISLDYSGVENINAFLAVINNRNNIVNTNTEEDIILTNVKYQASADLAVTGFYYGIDSDTQTDGSTLGIRNQYSLNDTQFLLEVATQDQTATDTKPMYWHINAAHNMSPLKATLGIELLASDDGKGAFATPLGTNHKFLGWTDTYLTGAGATGIQDTYLQLNSKIMGTKVVAQLHHFQADEVDADLGIETGLLVAKKLSMATLSAKISSFNATKDSKTLGKNNVTKVWLTASTSF